MLGDLGAFGVGLAGGALFDVKETEQVLKRARLAWVQLVRATGKPKAPPWIMKVRGLGYYFDALGGIDVDKYDSDEDAVHDVAVEADMDSDHPSSTEERNRRVFDGSNQAASLDLPWLQSQAKTGRGKSAKSYFIRVQEPKRCLTLKIFLDCRGGPRQELSLRSPPAGE